MARPSFPKHDLYKALGVESTASLDDIKKAYRDLCKKVHPDKAEGGNTPENNLRFQQVQEAWEILRDKVLRREYDDYRANGAKDSSHREHRDADSGRRRKARKEREERTGKSDHARSRRESARDQAYDAYPGGTYGSKPNRQRKPYYEKWGDTYYDDGPYETSQGDQYHSGGPPPFSGFQGPRPGPSSTRGPQYESYEEYHHVPQNPRGPPHATKLEDRIVTMRLRVDLRQASRDLDDLQAVFKCLTDTLVAEDSRCCEILEDVRSAFDVIEDLYDFLHMRLKEVEAAHPSSSATAHHLPELLGILQAHITRMKYSMAAVEVIMDELSYSPPPEAQRWLFDDLELRLRTMARAAGWPRDWPSG
ncbi:DnaJ-domain-containing protein [Hypoxylon sp. FL0890]|nr:DnaJ-domain-containing protein [Hypoxylon sp. FL0890]